jgi:thiamine-phosphate pyrophosphorylase
MVRRQPSRSSALPAIWLISDARNDAVIEAVLARLPRGSGFIFRHYHLDPAARRARFERLARIARRRGHTVILSGDAREARRWGADGAYGAERTLSTAHSLREIAIANRRQSAAIVLSPVFPTRSHPGATPRGPIRFRRRGARAAAPVIALGGMDARRARRLRTARWAAIDGICAEAKRWIPTDS